MGETIGPMEDTSYIEGMDLKLTPVVVRHLLGPLNMFGGLIASPNSPTRKYNLPPAAHPPHPPLTHTPLICATHDITVVVKSFSKLSSVS